MTEHTRGFEKVSGSVITLEPLTGIVIAIKQGQVETQANLKSYIVDVKLDKHPYYALYKDLKSVKVFKGQFLAKDTVIGTVYPGSHSSSGFHLALIKKEFYIRYRQLTPLTTLDVPLKRDGSGDENQTSPQYIKREAAYAEISDNMQKWFIDPAGPLSPVNCPGRGKILQVESPSTKIQYWEDNPMGNQK